MCMEDPNDDLCTLCVEGGALECCSNCVNAFHRECIKEFVEEVSALDRDDFTCSDLGWVCSSRSVQQKCKEEAPRVYVQEPLDFHIQLKNSADSKASLGAGSRRGRKKKRYSPAAYEKFIVGDLSFELGQALVLDRFVSFMMPESLIPSRTVLELHKHIYARVAGLIRDSEGSKMIELQWLVHPSFVKHADSAGRKLLALEENAKLSFLLVDQCANVMIDARSPLILGVAKLDRKEIGQTLERDGLARIFYTFTLHPFSGRIMLAKEDDGALNSSVIMASEIEALQLKRKIREISNDSSNVLDKATSMLQLSEAPVSLPCRDKEFEHIKSFMLSALCEGGSSSGLYISGMPGTGKTATIRRVLYSLATKTKESLSAKIPDFSSVEINCLKLNSPKHIYLSLWDSVVNTFEGIKGERFLKQLKNGGVVHSPAAALRNLENLFTANSKKLAFRKVLVVVVDELDYLVTSHQTELYNLFHWPSCQNSKLIVIGIANTMDLPERLKPRVQSRMGMNRLVFSPYTRDQIERILRERLEGVDIFDSSAVQFCAMKVAAVSGDIRRALQICARSVEICKFQSEQEVSMQENTVPKSKRRKTDSKEPSPKTSLTASGRVTMKVIHQATKELFSNNYVEAIRRASIQQKLFLVAILLVQKKKSSIEVDFTDVAHCHIQTMNLGVGSWKPSFSQVRTLAQYLSLSRIIKLENVIETATNGFKYTQTKVQLAVIPEDVKYALKDDKLAAERLTRYGLVDSSSAR